MVAKRPLATGKNVQPVTVTEQFHFSDRHRQKLMERFGQYAKGAQFVADLQKLVGLRVSKRIDHKSTGASASSLRANASAILQAAKQLKRSVGLLDDGQKALLGQLMWTVDKQNYAPAAFSVDQVAAAAHVLGQAAGKLRQGGRSSLQLEAFIRDVYAAYVVRFNDKPALSMAKDNDFGFALKTCLNAVGAPARVSAQLVRAAING